MTKQRKPKIVFLTQYYPPETGAPQNRISYIAQGLLDVGYDVQVITAIPNYPLGKKYPGFKHALLRKTIQNGVPVLHCWLFTSAKKKIFLRLINNLSFVLSSAIIGTFHLPKIDLLIVESPPLFLTISAWWLSKIKNAKIILNISDLYPETAISLGMLSSTWLQRIFYAFEAWSYNISLLIIGQTEGIVNSIRRRFPKKRVLLLTNGIILKSLVNEYNPKPTKTDRFIIGYAGVFGYAQDLQKVIETALELINYPEIEFHLYGDGPILDSLKKEAEKHNLKNVMFLGHRAHPEIISLMGSWKIGLVPLLDVPLMSGAIPSKMLEVMGLGLPVLLWAPEGEASHIILKANGGIWVSPDSPISLAEAIIRLYNDQDLCNTLGKNANHYVKQHFDRNAILKKLINVLNDELDL